MRSTFLGLMIILTTTLLQAQTLAKFSDLEENRVYSSMFQLKDVGEIKVSATLPYNKTQLPNELPAVWIIHSISRDVVYRSSDGLDGNWPIDYTYVINNSIELPAGNYEVYVSTWSGFNFLFQVNDSEYVSKYDRLTKGNVVGRVLSNMFSKGYHEKKTTEIIRSDMYVNITGSGNIIPESERATVQNEFKKNAIFSHIKLSDNYRKEQGFRLTKDVEIDIYANGELRNNEQFDYGWIYSLSSGKKVWDFNYLYSKSGGGATKNRTVKAHLRLPKGEYVFNFRTDDSHSFENWNSAPPFDPAFWGIVVKTKNESDVSSIEFFDHKKELKKYVTIDLTGMGNSVYEAKAFSVEKELDVKLHAIGEGSGGKMFDYAGLISAPNHEELWMMNYSQTKHAGGSSKNRELIETIRLSPGKYLLYFTSDDSHSYSDWNAEAPDQPELWGVTLSVVNPSEKAFIKTISMDQINPTLAKITRPKNSEKIISKFTIKAKTNVRVYAIGEGVSRTLADYGWIEDEASGEIVWEMTYSNTQHAGGDFKNRRVNTVISLKPGNYKLVYKTDDSHTFGSWNASPPNDQINYGISLYAVDPEN